MHGLIANTRQLLFRLNAPQLENKGFHFSWRSIIGNPGGKFEITPNNDLLLWIVLNLEIS